MSYHVKPEDVTQELLELAMERFENAYWNDVTAQNIADFLQDAIEAGLVSPPVYAVRDDQGNLLDYEVYGLWSNPDAAESQHEGDCAAEHWKGQRK